MIAHSRQCPLSQKLKAPFGVLLGGMWLFALPDSGSAKDADKEALAQFFESKVQPILSIRCYECHSHGKEMKGGLTLDSKSGWETGGDSGPAVVPGAPEKSPLIYSLHHDHEDLKMPPKDKLGKGEIEILTQWVKMGAPDPRVTVRKSSAELEEGRKHWAFLPVANPRVPVAGNGEFSHPVDAFLEEKRAEQMLEPSPLAGRVELIRRATYDLTGLPASADEIERFVNDTNADEAAFARVIDRLLASPAYGEKWGRHWLDIVRYGDTTGCSSDWPVDDAWRYRDWVVKAINQDKPFDQFITEQLAGDLLAADMLKSGKPVEREAYQDAIVATGLLALSKRYSVAPGTVPHLTIGDTIDQTWQALQGLTMGCARCHDHKFDPIPTADYYALYGIFESSIYPYAGAENNQMAPLLVPLDFPQQAAQDLDRWARKLPGPNRENKPRTLWLSNASRWGFEYHEESNHVVDRMPISPWISEGGLAVIQNQNSPFTHILPRGIKLVHFQGSQEKSILQRRVRWLDPSNPTRSFSVDFKLADLWDGAQQQFELAWKALGEDGAWQSLFTVQKDGLMTLLDGSEVKLDRDMWYQFQCVSHGAGGDVVIHSRNGDVVFQGRVPDTLVQVLHQEGDLRLQLATATLNGSREACVMIDNVVAECGSLPPFVTPDAQYVLASSIKDEKRKKELLAEATTMYENELGGKPETAFAMWEGTPRDSAIQKRGELKQPGEVVERGHLKLLGGQKLKHPQHESGRRELAGWLMDDSNPLTLRVFMNRVWQWHFGQGLVTSPNDFGHMGSKPSHPELLDHLVQVFREKGLSLKAMHRYLMLTHAYRQSSAATSLAKSKDPDNRWLSHFSPRRLTAEEIRDSMLMVSGLLERPARSVAHPFPPYHKRSWSQHSPFSLAFEAQYPRYDHHRRSLYLPSVRLLPDPFLSVFDAADSNLSIARRDESSSPLQGLALMNSALVMEVSQQLAKEVSEIARDEEADECLRVLHQRIFGVDAPQSVLYQLQKHHRLIEQRTEAEPQEVLAMVAQSLLISNAFLYSF
jgi:hypothetical protein